MSSELAYSFDDLKRLESLQTFIAKALKREYLKTIRYKATEEAVLQYLQTYSNPSKINLIYCFKMMEGYDNFEIVRIIKFLDEEK